VQGINFEEVIKWVNELSDYPVPVPAFLKPFHLVTLGLVAKRNKWNNLKLPEQLEKYAVRMKLWESVDMKPPCKVREYGEDGKFLPVQSFKKGKEDIQSVVEQVGKIVLKTTSKEYQDALSNCLQEIIDNFFAHAEASNELPCLVSAQSWPKGSLVQMAIADAGIGIRSSLNKNEELLYRLTANNACEMASEYGISSKIGDGHSGYGLTLAQDLMKQSGGTYILFSGDELFLCQNGKPLSKNSTNCGWNGTLLVLEWEMNKQLDASSVYNSWPMPDGMNEDDYFD
jgi:anti-sigma regulatory factor (Ser/Thr protein kinase)